MRRRLIPVRLWRALALSQELLFKHEVRLSYHCLAAGSAAIRQVDRIIAMHHRFCCAKLMSHHPGIGIGMIAQDGAKCACQRRIRRIPRHARLSYRKGYCIVPSLPAPICNAS